MNSPEGNKYDEANSKEKVLLFFTHANSNEVKWVVPFNFLKNRNSKSPKSEGYA